MPLMHQNNPTHIQDRAITLIALLLEPEFVLCVRFTAFGSFTELMQLLIGSHYHLKLTGHCVV
jgi:hypothetical protein